MTVTAYVKGNQMKNKVADILRRKEGEGFVDTALKILISVVVGALLLAGLYEKKIPLSPRIDSKGNVFYAKCLVMKSMLLVTLMSNLFGK